MSDKQGVIPFPFNSYGTDLGGATLGAIYTDHTTGKRFQLCQLDTGGLGTLTVGSSILVRMAVSGGNHYIVTDDVSDGAQATHPIAAGFATAAVPVSTSTVTYYLWVQRYGPVETSAIAGPTGGTLVAITTNGDDDIALGDTIIMTSADGTVDSVAAGTAACAHKQLGWAVAADSDSANTVTIFANVLS